jgi:hypothetical protein
MNRALASPDLDLRPPVKPLRVAILLESDRQIAAFETLADELCGRGHAAHLAVQGETVKDRDGALARLAARHLSLSIGQAPPRRGRWASLMKQIDDALEPLIEPDGGEDDETPGRAQAGGGASLGRMALAGLPADPDIAAYLGQLDLDLLLLAPRADPWSSRLDYLLACRRLGVRSALLAGEGAALEPLLGPGASIARDDLDGLIDAASSRPAPRSASWPARTLLEAVALARGLKRFAEDHLGADVRHGLALGLLRRGGAGIQDLYARWIFPHLMRGLLAMLPSRRAMFRDLLKEQLAPDEVSRLEFVEGAVEAARRGGAPIFLGPWTGGVGHELLYWIPMLRWFRKTYAIDKSRVVVISRGGVRGWYAGVIGHYLDVFDLTPLKRQQYREAHGGGSPAARPSRRRGRSRRRSTTRRPVWSEPNGSPLCIRR